MKIMLMYLTFALLFVCHGSASADDALRRKLGQLFIVGFIGPTVTDSLLADLSARNIGGVYLSYVNGNLVSPSEIQQLTSLIRSAAQTPPFLCIDQEGGRVARLDARNGFAATYSAYTLGMVFQSVDSTRAQAALMASWMAQCGLNLNLAPVVDVAASPYDSSMYYGRDFSTDPSVVTAHAQAFIEQFQNASIITTLKHFPGLGTPKDLLPYRNLLDSNRVDMIMVGHNFISHIDPVYLASLSAAAVQGLLRDSMGFDGVVITDDLYRMSTSRLYGYGHAARLALNAGDDVLLYVGSTANDGSLVRQIVDTLEVDVQQGRIAMSRIDEAYRRIMQLKNRYKVTSVPSPFATRCAAPDALYLSNYPNPFNPSTTIRYGLPLRSMVTLTVFNALGQQVAILEQGEKDAGYHEVRFDGTGLASGVYFYRLRAGDLVQTRTLLLIQ